MALLAHRRVYAGPDVTQVCHHCHHDVTALRRGVGRPTSGRLTIAFAPIGGCFFVELVGGLLAKSVALLSDAGHMLSDVVGIGISLAATQAARTRRADAQRSFGPYRLEILAALAKRAAVDRPRCVRPLRVESVRRLTEPAEVAGPPMLLIGTFGPLVNIVASDGSVAARTCRSTSVAPTSRR
jgi:cobalt-zinc-cadmium efflux system protein